MEGFCSFISGNYSGFFTTNGCGPTQFNTQATARSSLILKCQLNSTVHDIRSDAALGRHYKKSPCEDASNPFCVIAGSSGEMYLVIQLRN
jgi:hypothetical protein